MNLNKFHVITLAGLVIILVLTGCNGGGSARGNSNTNYGKLVSGESAPTNPIWENYGGNSSSMTVSMHALNHNFMYLAGCSGLESTEENFLNFCLQNITYLANESQIFGTNGQISSMEQYVTNLAESNNVNKAKFDMITYTTPGAPYLFAGQSTSNEIASGLVILPSDANGIPLPESDIKGVVLYFHGTVLSKAGVPSGYGNNDEIDYLSTTLFQYELAAIFTSAGYIVAAPDYIGQGLDINVVHPVALMPTPNAQSGIYMLSALNTYLQQKYAINLTNLPNPSLFIGSYSEGGTYALRASQLLQGSYANIINGIGLSLKRTVGGSGAYDLSHEMLPFAFSNVTNGLTESTNPWSVSPGCNPNNPNDNGFSATYGCPTESTYLQALLLAQYQIATAKPSLGTAIVNTFVNYYSTPAAYNLVMIPAYAQQSICVNPNSFDSTFNTISCSSVTGGEYSVQQLFNPNGLDQLQISTQLFSAAVGATNYFIGSTTNISQLQAVLASGAAFNSVGYFIYPSLLIDPSIMGLIGTADTYNWTTNSPVSLVYLTNDSIITNLNSQSAIKGITPSNLVTAVAIDNTQIWATESIPGTSISAPIYLNHGSIGAETIVDMAELNQILTNP